MDKNEYLKMYNLETNFWWYKVLHALVDSSIHKHKRSEPIHLLDAGCGTGRMMEICQKYGTVSGIDYSTDAVYFAKKRNLPNIELGDLNIYNFENNSYDVVVSLDVLSHSAIENDLAIIEKFYHTLRHNGLLIINLPAFDFLKRAHDLAVNTKKRYRKRAFESQLTQMGFTILQSSYRMPLLYCFILTSKLFCKTNKTEEAESDLKELPPWLNICLFHFGRLENWFIKHGFSFPIGSSLFVVAQKQG